MNTFYNDNDTFCCDWLGNLIAAGHLPAGTISRVDIRELRAEDVAGFGQAHFFAGLGGWPLALRLAGWPDERTVLTCSPPCQPFSVAGAGRANLDERNLWCEAFRLIRICRPATCLGEQVPGAIRFGWLDRVFADLESEGYRCGAMVLPACGVGAPHIRQRLFWVAYSNGGRRGQRNAEQWSISELSSNSDTGWMAHSDQRRWQPRHRDADTRTLAPEPGLSGAEAGGWSDSTFIHCADGKARRVPAQPALQPLVDARDGARNHVGVLRASGNGLVVPLAARFVQAVLECLNAPRDNPAQPA